uniref:Zgc:56304 n=1 Tax=Sinocyclocheilus anshuiensis TaxID=1608454 RepID=A0A671Q1T8_9TELE
MVMEKPSPLLVGREFVRQYYTLLNKAPDYLHRFYGRSSSYVHGGVDGTGKPEEAVYGQAVSECDFHQGSAVNKFYVHNDIFRYEEEVFGDSEAELGESEEEEVEEEQVETPASPEPAPDRPSSTTYYEPPAPPVSNGVEEQQEEAEPEAEPEPQPEASQEAEAELNPEAELQVAEVEPEEEEERGSTPSLTLTPPPQTPEPLKAFSWALVTSKNLPPAHVVKAAGVQPRVELKQDGQSSLPRDQRRERPGFPPRGPRADGSGSEAPGGKQYISFKGEFQVKSNLYPLTSDLLMSVCLWFHAALFPSAFGNMVEMRINTKGVGGRLPNFGFVVFDDSEPVQRILGSKPIMFRGEVRLNVEEKKSRAARERETRGAAEEADLSRFITDERQRFINQCSVYTYLFS